MAGGGAAIGLTPEKLGRSLMERAGAPLPVSMGPPALDCASCSNCVSNSVNAAVS